jgi:hypothetical protein
LLAMEQREVKAHWLAEKSDLQARFQQVLVLNTQLQGSVKKKDKGEDASVSYFMRISRCAALCLAVPLTAPLSHSSHLLPLSAPLPLCPSVPPPSTPLSY